jgi:hypothetical protein
MKNFLLVQFLFIFSVSYCQVKTPSLSPKSKIIQTVGLTDIKIEYSRPAVKSRKIFGSVVPYDKIWRTGANKNTTISFSKDVSFSGILVKKGIYSIYTIPNKSSWRLMLYNETENSGMPVQWNKNKIILDVVGQSFKLPFSVENFQIGINNITQNSAVISFNWDDQIAIFPFKVFTDKQVMVSIEETLSSGKASTWDYHNAALYFYHNDLDKNKSKIWFDKSLFMRKGPYPYWVYSYKAQIYNKYGDKKQALKAAKKSLELAGKTGNHHAIGMASRAFEEVKNNL